MLGHPSTRPVVEALCLPFEQPWSGGEVSREIEGS